MVPLSSRICLSLFSVMVMIISIHLLGVDLTLWAHEHSYERLWPLYNMQVRYLNQAVLSVHNIFNKIYSILSFCCRFAMDLWKSRTPTPVPQFISSPGQRYVINCNAFCTAMPQQSNAKPRKGRGWGGGGMWTLTWKGLGCLLENLN